MSVRNTLCVFTHLQCIKRNIKMFINKFQANSVIMAQVQLSLLFTSGKHNVC